jgi:aminomethyltransferase
VVKDKAFYGREVIWDAHCDYRLAGLVLTSRGIAREGYMLFYQDEHIGKVTSGTLSPLTRQSIALAWVKADYAHEGQALNVEIRGQRTPATIVKPPFF